MKKKRTNSRKKVKIELSLTYNEVALAIYHLADRHDLTEKDIKALRKKDIKAYIADACEESLPLVGHFQNEKLGKLLTEQVKKRFK